MKKRIYITEQSLLKIAMYSNAFYVFCLFIFRPNGINFGKIAISGLLLLSFFSFSIIVIRNKYKLKEIPKVSRIIFYFLIIYSFIVILRSFSTNNIQDWVTNFGNVYMAPAWLTPALLIIGFKIKNWAIIYKAIRFMFVLMVLALIIHFFGLGDPAEEWNWLFRPTSVILLTAFYKYNIIDKVKFLTILMLYAYIAIYTKFRFEFIYITAVLFFLSIDRLYSLQLKRSLLKYILIGFVIFLIYIFTSGYESFANFIGKIIEYQDSRTFLFTELFAELSKNETFFGRGSLGTYYSEFFEKTRRYYDLVGRKSWPGDNPERITIEVGYLQMILKGGFVMLSLYTSLAFYAAYIGVFRAKNKFVKRLSLYVIIILILSIVSLRPAFTPTFIIFWIAIGTILNKDNRNMSNGEINQVIS